MIISYKLSANLPRSVCSALLENPRSSSSFSISMLIYLFSTLQQPLNRYPDELLHHFLHKCNNAKNLKAVQSFHALTVTLGSYARQPTYFANNVTSLYMSFDKFDEMPQRNLLSYYALISAYSRNNEVEDAWELFSDLWICGFRPTQFTFGGLLSCATLDLKRGCVIHGLMLKNGLYFDEPHAGTALICMFDRHGCVDEAVRVFEHMPHKSLVTWNSVISLLGCHGFIKESMVLFRKLMRLRYELSDITFGGLLSGFEGKKALELGKQVQCLVTKNGLNCDVSTSNALLNMCVKCMDISSTERMFEEFPFQDVVTYNTLIEALVRSRRPGKGLELFLQMQCKGLLPNKTTYVGVTNSSTNLQVPLYGEYIHAKILRNSMKNDVFVGSALVDFYGKCDMLVSAQCCFDEIYDKNIVSWNSLIAAFTSRMPSASSALYQEMLQLGYSPNEFTFSAMLKAFSIFELQQLHCLTIRMGYLQNDFEFSLLVTNEVGGSHI